MNFNSFGEILYVLRKKLDLTQDEACKGICNRRTYIKWENNEIFPSFYYLECLSYRFNIDLVFYYKLFQCHKNSIYMHYDVIVRNLIHDKNYIAIKNLLPELERIEIRPPSFEQLIYLCKTIVCLNEKKYKTSINLCFKSLSVEDPYPTVTHPYGRIFSNTGMHTLVCLAYSYLQTNNENKALQIYLETIKLIDLKLLPNLSFYQSHEFEKKIYQYILYNISLLYEKRSLYDQSLEYINKALTFSNNENCLYFLPELFQLKLKIKYHLREYKEAYENYNYSLLLYHLQNRQTETQLLQSSLNTSYFFLKKFV